MPSRRSFIKSSLQSGLALGAVSVLPAVIQSCSSSKKTSGTASAFTTLPEQMPLAYAYNALEPVIDAQTMEIHYTKHAAAYSKNLKEAMAAESVACRHFGGTDPCQDICVFGKNEKQWWRPLQP